MSLRLCELRNSEHLKKELCGLCVKLTQPIKTDYF